MKTHSKKFQTYISKLIKITRPLGLGLIALIVGLPITSPTPAFSNEGQPKLFEPYAPKPSGKCPEGWEIKILDGSQVENSTTLSSGKDIKVTVPAYEIVAKTNPETIVTKDPGFDPVLGTTQRATIGAILTDYSEATIDLQAKLEKVTMELEAGLGAGLGADAAAATTTTTATATDKSADSEKSKKTAEDQKAGKPNEKKKSNSSSR